MNAQQLTQKWISKTPKFMALELDRVETIDDLLFQAAHEIDLAEEGDVHWTRKQLHSAKMFAASLSNARLEHAGVLDALNEATA